MNCCCYGAMKFLEHGMNFVTINEMQFDFLPEWNN